MGAVHYKYTDEQVAEDWDLYRSLATEYVQNYKGVFNLLIQYRERVAAGYDLTVPMVRATLNCMLHDAKVVNLPTPRQRYEDHGGTVRPITSARSFANSYPYDDHGKGDYEDDDDLEYIEPERPAFVKMPIKWHHDYGMTLHKQARVVHRVHPDSYAKWNTETNTGGPVIWWRCKGDRGERSMSKSKIIIMDSLEAAIHIMQSRGWFYLCRLCRELAGGQQVLVEEVLSLVDRGQVGTADLHPLRTWRSSSRHRVW